MGAAGFDQRTEGSRAAAAAGGRERRGEDGDTRRLARGSEARDGNSNSNSEREEARVNRKARLVGSGGGGRAGTPEQGMVLVLGGDWAADRKGGGREKSGQAGEVRRDERVEKGREQNRTEQNRAEQSSTAAATVGSGARSAGREERRDCGTVGRRKKGKEEEEEEEGRWHQSQQWERPARKWLFLLFLLPQGPTPTLRGVGLPPPAFFLWLYEPILSLFAHIFG